MLFIGLLSAQTITQPTIFITTSSVVQIPADNIYFTVVLSTQNIEAQTTYEDHKVLEKNLLEILKQFEIPDSNISYSLLRIGNSNPHKKENPSYKTHEVISFLFDEFDKYEPLQLAMLSNGIYEYRAKFTSNGSEEWIEKGVQSALNKAKEEAKLTAKNLGKAMGEVLEVESSHYYPSSSEGITALTMEQPGESLIDLPRFVQLRVSLRVKFALVD